jgi:hypothetical protein
MRQMTTLFGLALRRYVDASYVYRGSTALLPRVLVTASRARGERARNQRTAQLTARRDPELREHPVQVRADRAMREVQSLTDRAVRQALCRKLGDLQFLRGELIARLGYVTPAPLARRTQLAPRLLAPRCAPRGVGMSEVFVARQPIFDRKLDVVGYELLFRGGQSAGALVSDPESATAAVVLGSFTEIGLERIVGSKPAWVNLSREFLLHGHARSLPPGGWCC